MRVIGKQRIHVAARRDPLEPPIEHRAVPRVEDHALLRIRHGQAPRDEDSYDRLGRAREHRLGLRERDRGGQHRIVLGEQRTCDRIVRARGIDELADRQRHSERGILDRHADTENLPSRRHDRPLQHTRTLDIDREHTTHATSTISYPDSGMTRRSSTSGRSRVAIRVDMLTLLRLDVCRGSIG